jgi:hypothetical protein
MEHRVKRDERDEKSGETGKEGRDQRSDVGGQRIKLRIADFKKTGDKDSTVGAAFQQRSCDLNDLNDFNDFTI